jgi:adenylylsulfate kinase
MARELHDKAQLGFIEVFVDAPLEVVESRDPKGLYRKARAGEIKGLGHLTPTYYLLIIFILDFTGISAPYEEPENAEIHILTNKCDVTESVRIISDYLTDKGYI